jgi:hypothetical protein
MTFRTRATRPALLAKLVAAGVVSASVLVCTPVLSQGRNPGTGGGGGSRGDSGGGGSRGDSGRGGGGSSDSGRGGGGGGGSTSRGGGGGDSPAPRRDYTPPPRREEPAPRRDPAPPVNRDTSPPPRTESPAPRRDGGDTTSPSTRDRAPRTETRGSGSDTSGSSTDRKEGQGPGNISNRTRPTGDSNPGTRDRGTTTRDEPFGRNPDGNRTETRPGGRTPDPARDSTRDTTRERGSRAGNDPSPQRNRALDIFTRSEEGRRYNNGIVLRGGGYIPDRGVRHYFPHNYCYFPYYRPAWDISLTYYSPYSFYYGVCPPYIYRRHCYYAVPSYTYIEVPIYVGSDARGYDRDEDDYYLNRYRYDEGVDRDPELNRAIDDLREAFRYGSIEPLVMLTDPQLRIAIYLRGKYEYSVASSDYLDMTRDMLRTTETVQFDLYRFKRRAAGVFVVSGKHVYTDRDGKKRTVYVSFVLEKLYNRWTLTQVGTAPDRIQEWK